MRLFRYRDGILPDLLIMIWVLAAYAGALKGLAQDNTLIYVGSVVLLGHTLSIAAYLLHECIHQTIFYRPAHNRIFGSAMSWLTGAAYTPYHILAEKHIRHHSDRVDILAMDTHAIIMQSPVLFRFVTVMQWLHLPAIEIVTHFLSMLAPFILSSRRVFRMHVALVFLSRAFFFCLLWQLEPSILPGYFISWLIMLKILGFMDCLQHDYEAAYDLDEGKSYRRHDRIYEEAHTFSNLLSHGYPALNLLVLNFCYHNVHHYRPGIPWHRLPVFHKEHYTGHVPPVIPIAEQLRKYHRGRVNRTSGFDPSHNGIEGVSFLAGI